MTPSVPAVQTASSRIEAELYFPGRRAGFSDTTAGNEGAASWFDDVDIEYTPAIAGYDIEYIQPDEWLAFDLEASPGGQYAAAFRLACPYDGRPSRVEVNRAAVGRLAVQKTAGVEAYATAELPLDLAPGRHRLVFRFDPAENANLDRVDIRLLDSGMVTPIPTVNETMTVTPTPTVNITETPTANATPTVTPTASGRYQGPSDSPISIATVCMRTSTATAGRVPRTSSSSSTAWSGSPRADSRGCSTRTETVASTSPRSRPSSNGSDPFLPCTAK